MIQKPKGTKDILPSESATWQYVEGIIKQILENYSYKEIRVPVFEHTELFLRGVGETTDIVQKEMYTFEDKAGRSLTLRPEGTAGTVRAYIENGMQNIPAPVKLWYSMAMYRYENVQKGRYREFRQFGAEMFGSASHEADAEMISMIDNIFRRLNISNVGLEINSIGCPKCRAEYQKVLKNYISSYIDEYCEDCKKRLEKNPMRILDCKNEKCKNRNIDAPVILDYLCDECKTHFDNLKKILDLLKIKYVVNPKIVRGLDYYTRTVFEFIDNESNQTVLAGGRYDGLIEQLDGAATPAIGFATGLDRLVGVFEKNNPDKLFDKVPILFIATIGESANLQATLLVEKMRKAGLYVEKDICSRSLKAQFKYADKMNSKFVLTLGDDEIVNKRAKIKNMETGEEKEFLLDENGLKEMEYYINGNV